MSTSNVEEVTPLISNHGIPTAVPDPRRPYEKQRAVYCILASILFECVAFYAIDVNLPWNLSFNETLNWNPNHSAIPTYTFNGTYAISLLIFAIISDAILKRATMIIIGFPIYFIGFVLNVLLAKGPSFLCPPGDNDYGNATSLSDERCVYWVFPAAIVTAIGAGAVRANLIAFGADQIQEFKVRSRYVDKLVVAMNIGSITLTSIVIIITDGPDNYFQLFISGVVALFFAALVFLMGRPYYIHVKPYDSVVTNCIPVFINAFRTWRQYKPNTRYTDDRDTNVPVRNSLDASDNLTNEGIEESIGINEQPSTFLDYARARYDGKYQDRIVDDVRSLRNDLILLIITVPYWIILYQFFTTFQDQGTKMAHPTSEYIFSLLFLIEPVTPIIGIIILNMFVYKYLRARNRSLTIATKFIISMCFAFVSMCITGGIEIWRQNDCITNSTFSSLPVYMQIPQDVGISIAQLFALLGCFEFALFVAPRSAQTLFVSLYFFLRSVASYSSYTIAIELDKHNTDYLSFKCVARKQHVRRYFTFFFILAGVQLIFIIIFIVCQKKIRMIRLNRQQIQRNRFVRFSPTRSIDCQ